MRNTISRKVGEAPKRGGQLVSLKNQRYVCVFLKKSVVDPMDFFPTRIICQMGSA